MTARRVMRSKYVITCIDSSFELLYKSINILLRLIFKFLNLESTAENVITDSVLFK